MLYPASEIIEAFADLADEIDGIYNSPILNAKMLVAILKASAKFARFGGLDHDNTASKNGDIFYVSSWTFNIGSGNNHFSPDYGNIQLPGPDYGNIPQGSTLY